MTLRPPRRGFSVSRHLSERARAARDEAARPDPQSGDPDIAADGGFAGMVGALRGLVEQFAAAAQQQAGGQHSARAEPGPEGSAARSGQHEVSFGDGKARMVFGYTLRMGRDGISAEPFGNTAPTAATKRADPDAGSAPAALLPIVEVFEDGNTVVVVAELPGADPDRIVFRVEGQRLLIEATGLRSYRKDLPLPAPVRADGVVQSFRNGILEVRLPRADRA
jgi:HSP20 family protein